jgi:arylsulfatase A-like enzyme
MQKQLFPFLGFPAALSLWLSCAFIALAAHAAAPKSETPDPKPNILIILADDMGFSDAGCYGGEIQTPNLDRLAANGLRFTQFYNTARCWPTRSALLTGYYPQQIRMDPPQGRLPGWARLLPTYLKPLGYRSYHSGKWHVNGAPSTNSQARRANRSARLGQLGGFIAPRLAGRGFDVDHLPDLADHD